MSFFRQSSNKKNQKNILNMDSWQSLAYCTGLENQRPVKGSIGSNPILSSRCLRVGTGIHQGFRNLGSTEIVGSNPIASTK